MAGRQRPKRFKFNKSCILLIVISGIERFAFKGVASNLVTYLTDVVKMSNSSAAKMVNSWCGFTSIMPLLVAPIADAYFHKYSTIMASSFLYVAGLAALTSTAIARTRSHNGDEVLPLPSSFLILSLYLISLGQGGYNPSLQAFGADQVDEEEELPCSKDDENANKKSLFFQWWYFGICGGSLLGVTVMSYIQDTFGWVLGFAIPAISMGLSILIFSAGSTIYLYKQHDDDDDSKAKIQFVKMLQAIKGSAFRCFGCGRGTATRPLSSPNDHPKSEMSELELQERSLCDENSDNNNPRRWIMVTTLSTMFPNAKSVLGLLPIWTTLLMFAVIFQQPATFFTKQGMTMHHNLTRHFTLPPATLQSAITLSILLLMPLYNRAFIPLAQLLTRHRTGVTVTQRIGIGMLLSVAAMVVAALVEKKRLRIGHAEAMSIFWLLPQYVLLGISDIFTVVGMQEFFYGEVPSTMRTMGIALYTSVFGVGSFVSALLITLVEIVTASQGKTSWFCDDMNEARLDNYYWLLAFLSAISFVFYVFFSIYYYRRSNNNNTTDQSDNEN